MITINSEWSTQWFVLFFRVWIVASTIIVLAWLKDTEEEEEESQKIDDLPVWATCWSGTLAILSSEGNVPVAHGSTR